VWSKVFELVLEKMSKRVGLPECIDEVGIFWKKVVGKGIK